MELQCIKAGPPLFDGFLKIYPVTLKTRPGACAGEQAVCVLTRPGHNSAIIAPITFDEKGRPRFVLKEGDVRPSALLRGEPYVATGMVAGSLDHAGEDGMKIAAAELGEEIGARPLAALVELGLPLPTMCVTDGKAGDIASTESDQHYMAPVSALQEHPATGDGGGMEIAGIMKPRILSIREALSAMDSGEVREGARARVSLGRALDYMGYIPELHAYISDLPPELQKRFTTCGLGEPRDFRALIHREASPSPGKGPKPPVLKPLTISADLGSPRIVPVGPGASLLDMTVQSLSGAREAVGKPFRCQALHVDYDRVKVAVYFVEPGGGGPMVRLEPVTRPVLAAKQSLPLFREKILDRSEKLGLTRLDVPDLRVTLPPVTIEGGKVKGNERVRRESGPAAASAVLSWCAREAPGAKVAELGKPVFASAGQSDLRYHFYAALVEKPGGSRSFMPLAEALRSCRAGGDGDAHTEALLLRLASKLRWLPSLGMPVQDARRVMDTH